jgi:hypothetical protein
MVMFNPPELFCPRGREPAKAAKPQPTILRSILRLSGYGEKIRMEGCAPIRRAVGQEWFHFRSLRSSRNSIILETKHYRVQKAFWADA